MAVYDLRAVPSGLYVYRVEYVLPGRASHTTTFQSETPIVELGGPTGF